MIMTDYLNEIQKIAAALPPESFDGANCLLRDLYDLHIGENPASATNEVLDAITALALDGPAETGEIRRYKSTGDEFREGIPLALHAIAQRAPEAGEAAIARLGKIAGSDAHWEICYHALLSIMNMGRDDARFAPHAVKALAEVAKSGLLPAHRGVAHGFLDMIVNKHPAFKSAAIAAEAEGTQDTDPVVRYGSVKQLGKLVSGLGAEEAGKLMSVFEAVVAKPDTADVIAAAREGLDIVRRKTAAPAAQSEGETMTDYLKEIEKIAAALPPQYFNESGLLQLDLYDLKIGEDSAAVTEDVLDALTALALGGRPDAGKVELYETPDDDFRRGVSLALHGLAQYAPEWSEAAIARLEKISASDAQWEVRINSMQSIMNLGEDGDPHTPFAVAALARQAATNYHPALRSAARGFLDMIADKHPEAKSASIAAWAAGTEDEHPVSRHTSVRALCNRLSGLGAEEAGKLMSVFEKVASKADRPDTLVLAEEGMEIVRLKTRSPTA
jgi:hypothetical protein